MIEIGDRRRAVVFAVLALLSLGAVITWGFLGTRTGAPGEAQVLAARASVLDAQLALVREDARYLVLDPGAGTLTLYHGAAALRSWPILEVKAGSRRMGDDGSDWRTRRWDGARMEPPVERDRRVIVSDAVEAPDLSGAVEWIPPTPEEAIPTPRRFVVHYVGGLGLEVLAAPTDSTGARAGIFARAGHRLHRILPRNWDHFRIQVRMDADEAGRLYRALPDSTSLLAIVPNR